MTEILSLISLILHVVDKVRGIGDEIEQADRQASRLVSRLAALEAPLRAVKDDTKLLSSAESSRQLLLIAQDSHEFLAQYARSGRFAELCGTLTEVVQALQLDIAVDAWAKEDNTDRLADIEGMVDWMEAMERTRQDNHRELVDLLKPRAVLALECLRKSCRLPTPSLQAKTDDDLDHLRIFPCLLEIQVLRIDERSELQGWNEVDYTQDLDFKDSVKLGEGAFGAVRTAGWRGSHVAVKTLSCGVVQRDTVRSFREEVKLHSSLHFDHVVPLYAASTVRPHLCLVMELARESLHDFLRSSSDPLEHALQIAFLLDIARGMLYLHGKGVLHRDLKSRNALVFSNGRLKLCDFGLSKVKTDISSISSSHQAVGSSQWMSPEEMNSSPASKQTDVYSFGICCFEVVTRADPFPGMKPLQLLMAVFFEKRRPQIPSGSSPAADVVALMNDCWEQDPGERPDGFLPVVETLSSAVERMGDPQGGTEIEFTSRSRQNILDGAPVIRGAATTKVLFVCFGNTCRSPVAEAIFKRMADKAGVAERFYVDSCGTLVGNNLWYDKEGHTFSEGDPYDERMKRAAEKRGIELTGASRALQLRDLVDFDLLLLMDTDIGSMISSAVRLWGKKDIFDTKWRIMASYCHVRGAYEIPDPYYGGPQVFEAVLDLLEDACQGLLRACLAGEA